MRAYYNIDIGHYSYGECLQPGRLPKGTIVGNYCSFASGIKVFRRNHPGNFISLHPFFYNSNLGWVEEDKIESIEDNPLLVMHDAWIGEGVIITPSCRRIGLGSIVGAGSVVTRDVPDFTVVAGNTVRVIKKRFNDEICSVIKETCWWKYSLDQLIPVLPLFLEEASIENALRLAEHIRAVSSG